MIPQWAHWLIIVLVLSNIATFVAALFFLMRWMETRNRLTTAIWRNSQSTKTTSRFIE